MAPHKKNYVGMTSFYRDSQWLFLVWLILNVVCFKVHAQDGANYQYDAQGRLTTDLAQGIVKIEWNNLNKIVSITRADTSHLFDIVFAYDAKGNRIMKLVIPRNGVGRKPQTEWRYTHYINDDAGDVKAIYESDYVQTSTQNQYEEHFTLKDNIIHSSQRIGYQSK